MIGFGGQIELEALRLFGLLEAAPAALNETPLLTGALFGSGRRKFAVEVSWELPSLALGSTALIDVTLNGAHPHIPRRPPRSIGPATWPLRRSCQPG